MSALRRPSRPLEYSILNQTAPKIDFVCDYTIKHSGQITFGWKCVATMEPYIANLWRELDIKRTNYRQHLPSCDSVCSEHGAHQPTYDDFMSINRTILASFCKIPKRCGFNVVVSFDFKKLEWTKKDGTTIDNLTWTNSGFPQYRNLVDLQIHNRNSIMVEYVLSSSSDEQNWSYKVNLDSKLDISPFGSGKRTVNQTGFYFCADEIITDENLKHGTFKQAREKCNAILTPKICNETVKDRLIKLRPVSSGYKVYSFNSGPRKVSQRKEMAKITRIYNDTRKILDWV